MSLVSTFPRPALRPMPPSPWSRIAPRTGPLETLADRSAVVFADLENLRYGAADLGRVLDLERLGERLRSACRRCRLHAFHSSTPAASEFVEPAERGGWALRLEAVDDAELGPRRSANIDNLLLLWAGRLLSRGRPGDLVVVASGDGALVQSIARFVAGLGGGRDVVTCSLPGSTSRRLDTRRNPLIAANLEIGSDCLDPLVMRRR